MTSMIPNAKQVLSMAQVLFRSTVGLCVSMPQYPNGPRETMTEPPSQCEQFSSAMKRSSYTPAIKAPKKQRSIKATKIAERRVVLYRMVVSRAQNTATTLTMKSTRM